MPRRRRDPQELSGPKLRFVPATRAVFILRWPTPPSALALLPRQRPVRALPSQPHPQLLHQPDRQHPVSRFISRLRHQGSGADEADAERGSPSSGSTISIRQPPAAPTRAATRSDGCPRWLADRDRAARSGPPGWAVMADHSRRRAYCGGLNHAPVASPSCAVPVCPGFGEAPLKPRWLF